MKKKKIKIKEKKEKNRKERLTHAQRNQQKRREELIGKFRELSAPQQKVALDFVEHANQFFNEDLHPGRSTFTKPLIRDLFHDAQYSTVTDIAKVTGKSETTVRDALKGNFKNNELKERAQPLNVKRPRLSTETIERAFEAQDSIAPTKSGKNYVILKYSDESFYEKCKELYPV